MMFLSDRVPDHAGMTGNGEVNDQLTSSHREKLPPLDGPLSVLHITKNAVRTGFADNRTNIAKPLQQEARSL